MKGKASNRLIFIIDGPLKEMDHGKILHQTLVEQDIVLSEKAEESKLNIIFTDSVSAKNKYKVKNKIVIVQKSEKPIASSQSYFEVDFRAFEEVSNIIDTILVADWWSSLNYKLKESEKCLEIIRNKNLSSDKNLIQSLGPEIGLLSDLELLLLREEDLDKWNLIIKNYCKKNHLFNSINFIREKDLFHDEGVLDANSLVFHLPVSNYFLIIRDKNISKEVEELKIELLVLIVLRTLQSIDDTDAKDSGEINFWKKIFSKIPYPMAVISQLGEMLIYNEHFASVGILPRECLSYKDNDHLEISQQFYKIRRYDFTFNGNVLHYYIFYTSEKIINNPNNELGIVSSSIAHELNNPLAGILAALTLLRLEDDWSDEAKIEIDEMKDGAKRCKELIDIFLGFSRMSPKKSGESSLKLSVDQAINLLRFRMMESDLRLDMKLVSSNDDLNFDINASVLSMVLYLIFSELMTAFAHHRLLSPKASSILEGKVSGNPHQVQFILNEEFDYEKDILDSKLLQHLLFFEKLEIVFLKNEIRLLKTYK